MLEGLNFAHDPSFVKDNETDAMSRADTRLLIDWQNFHDLVEKSQPTKENRKTRETKQNEICHGSR